MDQNNYLVKFLVGMSGTMLLVAISAFVWLFTSITDNKSDISVLKEKFATNEAASLRIELALKESSARIETERAANDKRVADDLHELRNKVFK